MSVWRQCWPVSVSWCDWLSWTLIIHASGEVVVKATAQRFRNFLSDLRFLKKTRKKKSDRRWLDCFMVVSVSPLFKIGSRSLPLSGQDALLCQSCIQRQFSLCTVPLPDLLGLSPPLTQRVVWHTYAGLSSQSARPRPATETTAPARCPVMWSRAVLIIHGLVVETETCCQRCQTISNTASQMWEL